MEIIGRTEEMAQLNRYATSNQPEFVAIYGRRRVGKTFLINKTLSAQMVFETSGVLMGEKDDQFAAFNQSLRRIGYTGKAPHKWMDLFFALEQTLTPRLDSNKRQIIFIDELPCFDVTGTRFVAALGHFWNSWVSKHDNLMLIVCGSATSWMVDNIVNNHGGLHDRITHLMHLHPFNLAQCEQFFQSRNMPWDRLSMLQAYMVFGGVPYYLGLIEPAESVTEAIDRLLFSGKGELHEEYNRLFASLFKHPEPYIDIIRALATLKDAGIDYTGAGNSLEEASQLIVKTDAKGRTYGFLACSHVIPVASWNVLDSQPGEFCFYDETDLIKAVEAADSQVDYLFVMVHWGTEHTTELTDYQVNDGHKMIDAGAEAVIGMHSHCLQPVEYYNGKPIFYSLGNFIFNPTIKSGCGGAVEFTIDENDAVSYRIVPIFASDACTSVDPEGYSYVESISTNVAVDENGIVSEK